MKKRGITLVSTLIVLVVMVLIAAAVTFSVQSIIDDVKKKEFDREYAVVKMATEDYVTRNSGVIDFIEIELEKDYIDNNETYQFDKEEFIDDKISVYIIDLEKIGVSSATYGTGKLGADDVYLLSKETNTVYYKMGYEDNLRVYYKP